MDEKVLKEASERVVDPPQYDHSQSPYRQAALRRSFAIIRGNELEEFLDAYVKLEPSERRSAYDRFMTQWGIQGLASYNDGEPPTYEGRK